MHTQEQLVEIIPNRLYFHAAPKPPRNSPKSFYFSTETMSPPLVYKPYNQDFGPFNLSMTHRYCQHLKSLLSKHKTRRVYHYTSLTPTKRANACYLLCAFQVTILNKTSHEA